MMKYTKVCKICMLTAGAALTVLTAVLCGLFGIRGGLILPVKSTGDIPETAESLDMLDCMYFESSSYLDGNAWIKLDFSAYTASIESVNPDAAQSAVAFTEKQAQRFLQTANDCGLFRWRDRYRADAEDIAWDRLEVCFADGSVKIVFCSNAYPPDFDILRDALLDLAKPRKTVDSLDMLHSIRYEGGGYLAGSSSVTVDFSAYTADIAFSDSWDGGLGEPTAQYTASFTEAQAQSLLQTANDCNLFGWDEYYACEDVEDGTWAALTVEFADGTVQEVFCSNKYPPDFEILKNALRDLGDLHS